MLGLSAVIFVPDDTAKTGLPQPLLLQNVLGAPLLAWLTDSLYHDGIGRFFLVCHDKYVEQACHCLPAHAEVMTTMDSNPADLLHVFLSTTDTDETDITVVAGPVIYAPMLARSSGTPVAANVFRADRELLMDSLDENFVFSRFLKDNCAVLSDYDGYFMVDSPAAALDMAIMLRRDRALRLMKLGVEIFDPDNCYISPGVRFESGVKLLPGCVLRGRTIVRADSVIGPWSVIEDSEIGENVKVYNSMVSGSKIAADSLIGPYAHIRDGCEIGRGVRIGNFVEVKNAKIQEKTMASHLSYIGDAEIGSGCNLGSGTATVNFDRVSKHKTTIKDNAFVGCHTALVAPVTVGAGAYIAAGSVITEDVPENALGIARSRQSNKKDWAAKHKKQD